ncbi:hypothetical protein ES703_90270 [subsurface metagenome]
MSQQTKDKRYCLFGFNGRIGGITLQPAQNTFKCRLRGITEIASYLFSQAGKSAKDTQFRQHYLEIEGIMCCW